MNNLIKRFFEKKCPARTEEAAGFWKSVKYAGRTNLEQYLEPQTSSEPQISKLKARQVSPALADKLFRLKNRLANTRTRPDETLTILRHMAEAGAFSEILPVLYSKYASESLYTYTAELAMEAKDYLNAVRFLKEIPKPIVFKPLMEHMVAQGCLQQIPDIIKRIYYYAIYYHRLTPVDANSYVHHAYMYASLAACQHKHYDHAEAFGQRVGRCVFAWVEMVQTIVQHQDFFMVERFAEQAQHLKNSAYTIAHQACPEDSPWKNVFAQKLSDKAPAIP